MTIKNTEEKKRTTTSKGFQLTTKLNFSDRFKALRKSKYKTVEDFIKAFDRANDMYLSNRAVNHWEQGDSIPEVYTLIKLCDFFGCDLDYLFGRIDTTTHAIEVIEKETGLSVPAIKRLIEWNNGSAKSKAWISYISKIFEHKEIFDVMNGISDFFMYSMCEIKAVYNNRGQAAIDAIDMQTASLWKIQKHFIDIIEVMGAKYGSRIQNEEKQKSRS